MVSVFLKMTLVTVKGLAGRPFKNAQGDRGASVTEFLICAPFVMLLFYVCWDLNQRIETRREVRIAGRNLAMGLSDATDPADLAASASQDISSSWAPVSIAASRARQEPKEMAKATFVGQPGAAQPGTSDDQRFEKVSLLSGIVASNGTSIMDGVKNFDFAGERLFIADQPDRVEITVKSAGDANVVRRGMSKLSAMVEKSYAEDSTDLLAATDISASFSRASAGYYPTDYEYQGLLGAFVGASSDNEKKWGSADKSHFVSDCMMSFSAKSNCKPMSWNAATMRVMYVVVAIVKCIASLGSQCAGGRGSAIDSQGARDALASNSTLTSGVESATGDISRNMTQGLHGAAGSLTPDFTSNPFVSQLSQFESGDGARLRQELSPAGLSGLLNQ